MNDTILNTPQNNDEAFREAFESAVRDLEEDSKAGALSSVSNRIAEDPSEQEQNNVAEEVEDEVQDEYVEAEDPSETLAQTEPDYKALYLKQQQLADAQIGLLHSRLGNLKNQYQELKRSVKQQVVEEEEIPAKLPDRVRDTFENYPDLGEAIQEYIKHELGRTRSSLKHEIDSRTQPIYEQMANADQQRHEAIIRRAHPDLDKIFMSGDVLAWIQTLPPVLKAGAAHVYNGGSAEEVVALLDDYKQARGITNAIPSRKVSPREHEVPADGASAPKRKASRAASVRADSTPLLDEETTRRLVSALGVPSNRGPVEIKEKPSFHDEFDAYARQFEKQRRR